jgi:hypothetical protein
VPSTRTTCLARVALEESASRACPFTSSRVERCGGSAIGFGGLCSTSMQVRWRLRLLSQRFVKPKCHSLVLSAPRARRTHFQIVRRRSVLWFIAKPL